ncbi:MAG: flagellar basal body protein, partial [Candidatus Cloacimonetes bacterium]|nr:flagellar basal body protein [Candidatus Cloacimonadota bacterium]
MLGSLFNAIDISASGLYAQRTRMNVISENIANAETTRTEEGGPYRRQITMLESGMSGDDRFKELLKQNVLEMERTHQEHRPDEMFRKRNLEEKTGVRVSDIVKDQSPFIMKYDPYHPDA